MAPFPLSRAAGVRRHFVGGDMVEDGQATPPYRQRFRNKLHNALVARSWYRQSLSHTKRQGLEHGYPGS